MKEEKHVADLYGKLKINIMKLYYLNPNDYGIQWFVMSDSKENALKSIIHNMIKEDKSYYDSIIDTLKSGILPDKYSLDEYNINEVISSEIC